MLNILLFTDEKPYKCSFCDYACRDSSTLRKHQERHGGKKTYYQCKTCDKTFSKKWLLKNHVAEIHLNINTRTIPCNFCDKKFKSNSNLNFHIKAFHKRALAGHCPVCNIYLANMRNLPIHLTTHVDARPFVCNVPGCGKSYKDKVNHHHISFHHLGSTSAYSTAQRLLHRPALTPPPSAYSTVQRLAHRPALSPPSSAYSTVQRLVHRPALSPPSSAYSTVQRLVHQPTAPKPDCLLFWSFGG
ncbi:hypothetical protein NE865_08215 [Phthorimaea operculella]|nr:hypothetical protein NE865_08215 [Phthorimaea operculella]